MSTNHIRRRTGHRPRYLRMLIVLSALIPATVCAGSYSASADVRSGTAARPFAASAPWNTTIGHYPSTDPRSAQMVRSLQPPVALHTSIVEFGIPVYVAGRRTPRYSVPCRVTTWGPCPFSGLSVPVPNGARPSTGSDSAMVVVDERTNAVYEFWRVHKQGRSWSAAFGAVNTLTGSGWGGAATGSGASRLGGVVRLAEIARGNIPHALALQTNNACAVVFRSPAIKTDGRSARSDCIPEGARLQLDPSIDLNSLGLTPAERTVATAMQRYGGYIVDIGSSALSVSFERDPAASGNHIGGIYRNAGLRWDYDSLGGVPWNRLRVVK